MKETESRGNHSLCSGMELHHPIMSKLWDLGGQTKIKNNISSGAHKFYAGFQKVVPVPLEHCDFVDPQGRSWISPYQTQNNFNYFQIEIFKVNPYRERNIVVLTVC